MTKQEEPGEQILESVYHRALLIELGKRKLSVDSERESLINHDGENRVVVELKAVDDFSKAAAIGVGLLVNFSTERRSSAASSMPEIPLTPTHRLISLSMTQAAASESGARA